MYKILLLAALIASLAITNASAQKDSPLNRIDNCENIAAFYNKLEQNANSVEILHIGDSHIQANFLSGYMRTSLQSKFGNAGRGFVFPYRLARTNGANDVHFFSDITWKRYRIITEDAKNVGKAGYNIYTSAPKFFIQLKVDENATFSEIFIEGKGLKNMRCGIPKISIKPPKPSSANLKYRVRQGDYLGKIARKFRVSVKKIKAWNHLRSNMIRVGQRLRIMKRGKKKPWSLNDKDFEWLKPIEQTDSTIHLITRTPNTEFFLVKNDNKAQRTEIHGYTLNNMQDGICYNSIGVNGAKFIDFNSSNIFFSQLKHFKPDLIIISIGTNEAFDGIYSLDDFESDLSIFCNKVIQNTGCNAILLTTPPSALVHRRYTNKKLPKYTKLIKDIARRKGYAVWDLFNIMNKSGGMRKWSKKGLASKDRIHFSKSGYTLQGDLLYKALINKRCNDE